jgi:site-specific DNA-methyltransferase (adenine-specific)
MPEASVDAVVTDPPYGLGFMGKKWDYDVPSVDIWGECLRVLKPGGYLLAFASTRTQHRMACRIEDAGFYIRDMIAWVYGSGFPKSLDVSEAVAMRRAGVGVPAGSESPINPNVYKVTEFLRHARMAAGWSNKQIDALFGTNGMAGHWTTSGSQPAVPSLRQWAILKEAMGFDNSMDGIVEELCANERPDDWGTGEGGDGFLTTLLKDPNAPPAGGWGTALKPALEPITVAQKPLIGTFKQNILSTGCGALNIDGCRIGDGTGLQPTEPPKPNYKNKVYGSGFGGAAWDNSKGRWPANLVHDGSEGNNHPTVKPTDLMRWLVRLVTPPGGVVLDPFMGSGSTGRAAIMEALSFIGIERDEHSHAIASTRIGSAGAIQPAEQPTNDPQKLLWEIIT